jgi:hypothetical protein
MWDGLDHSVEGRAHRNESGSIGAYECDNFPNGPVAGLPDSFHRLTFRVDSLNLEYQRGKLVAVPGNN